MSKIQKSQVVKYLNFYSNIFPIMSYSTEHYKVNLEIKILTRKDLKFLWEVVEDFTNLED